MAGDVKKLSRSTKDEIFAEAKERLDAALSFESEFRVLSRDDTKFANGDPDNHWQWPSDIFNKRSVSQRPCLTINKTRQYNLAIVNDCKQNRPSIKYRPTGGGASAQSAKMWNAIARRIEYQSNAPAAYDLATAAMVEGGIGYWRLETDYAADDSFDQDLYIRPVRDALSVVLDPNIVMPDGSDANWGFIFEDLEKSVFEVRYPRLKDIAETGPGLDNGGWISDKTVRVAEYFRKVQYNDELLMTPDGPIFKSVVGDVIFKGMRDTPNPEDPLAPAPPTRTVMRTKIERIFIAGSEVQSVDIWPGTKYIPIVRAVGQETVIEGRLDRKGHTRALKDAQRMYNYWTSAGVEYGALQTKVPYMVDAQSISGYEKYWESANTENYAYLPYNSVGEAGEQLQPPKRIEPPAPMPVAMTAIQVASNEMTMASGQTDAAMGAPGNERTGEALMGRQRASDRATYHFIDSLAAAIRLTGKIILDVVPKIYDTERVLVCLNEDETQFELKTDPQAAQAYQEKMNGYQEVFERMFNPRKGEYEVVADQGPSYATQRQEAFNAFTLMLTQSPEAFGTLGDLLFKAANFPMADEAAERLRRGIPPHLLGKGPSPAEQQLQAQMADLQQQLSEALYENAELKLRNADKGVENENKEYQAVTQRLDVLLKALAPFLPAPIEGLAGAVTTEAIVQDTNGSMTETAEMMQQGLPNRIPPHPGPDSGLPAPRPMSAMIQPTAQAPAPQRPQGPPNSGRPAGPPPRGPMGPGGQ